MKTCGLRVQDNCGTRDYSVAHPWPVSSSCRQQKYRGSLKLPWAKKIRDFFWCSAQKGIIARTMAIGFPSPEWKWAWNLLWAHISIKTYRIEFSNILGHNHTKRQESRKVTVQKKGVSCRNGRGIRVDNGGKFGQNALCTWKCHSEKQYMLC